MSLDEFAEALYPASAQSVIDGTVRALNALVSYEIDLLFRYAERCRGGIVGRLWSRGHTWVIRSVETLRILAEPGSLRDLWQRTEKSGLPASDWIATVRATLNRLQTEIRLDVEEDSAATFGLSKGIRPDFLYAVTLLGDLKLGADSRNYDRVATGYAIFAEYVLKRRINTSAILAVDLDIEQGMLRSHTIRMVHPGDELRMQWVTQRDMALSIFARPTEPIHPDDTAQCTDCHFRSTCWEHGTVGGAPILDGKVLAV
jgi:hypothetical protein